MMQIASRIANGAFSTASSGADGAAYRFNLEGLPGRWEDSEEEREHDYEDDEFFRRESTRSTTLRRDIENDDYHDLEEEDDDDNDLDDFGVPLGNDTPARNGRRNWGWVKTPGSSPKAKRGNDLVHGRSDNDQALLTKRSIQEHSGNVVIEND